ncbi:dynamin family protein [Planktothrix agardhii 1806]|uniref:dynamin family protein n=1 Tax=Planktothrix agardhii TaxID=1160 RepID=UPI001F440D61|nr:dynamin family protein [Planktothrix agardhii]MCF3569147.1 dynamin family protein [Planktothrix agardhii 1807]MCF3569164.1 dynamin family protein [Planktothrix agardhii 1807]MCF3572769.1 dynamin family protein [Planktothrix agardhii 1805]MCF3587420.1 dynamin family protein [Planktothrix agardhii 1803]MCF3604914.1 dynamin family protein [Planktothrix agardhii 1804]
MELNIESKLNNTRNLLQELGNSVSNLVNSSPDVFADPGIQSCLQDFLTVYQEAVQRLENPSFRIATLGTTSSGKSTIVNALIGRKIAPIEAGEMSGGVLTIQHSQEQKLIIEKTEDAVWDTGESTGSDEDLYQRISSVMRSYNDERKNREYVAPQITAHVPLLPACDASLLGLPNGIGVELIDLPGLKSVQDRTNLATIQKQVNKAFSLVALDYMQVDDKHRKCLLEELKKVVEYLQGRTDSMIFILNRVDQRGADDLPLSVRIDKLREEIKEVLSLRELPDVLPFNARLLYYAQCAWGSGSFNQPSTVDQATRSKFLKALFEDCFNRILQCIGDNVELAQWFFNLRMQIISGNNIDDETMRKILHYSLEWSGGRELWDCFRVRVKESFSELVILPALLEVFDNYDALEKLLEVVIQARKINNQEQVEQERDQIAKIRQNLQKNIKKIGKEFKVEIEELIENLKKNDRMINDKVVEETEKIRRKGFERIYDAVAEVEGDLTTSLIVPVRDAFKHNQGAFELRDKLGEVTSPALADDISKAYDNVSRRLSKFSSESEYLVKRVRADDDQGKKELERDEWDIRLLYHRMREAISKRAEFVLQSKAKQFEQALESLVDEQVNKLKVFLTEGNFSSINLEQAAISNLRKKLAQDLPKLPENFFDLQDNFKPNSSKKIEVVGQKTEKETRTKTEQEEYEESYKNGSCLKTTKTRTKTRPVTRTYQEVVTRDITQDVEYIELFLPPHDLMAKQWSSGIEKGKKSLWDVLLDWILKRLDDVISNFEESVDEITNLAERALQQQSSIIEGNFEQEKQFWRDFEVKKNHATADSEKLQEICRQ